MDVPELVTQFATSVAAQSEAIARGDHKSGNKHAKAYVTAFETIRRLGLAGRDALSVLLSHDRPDVRVMAASYLLRHSGQRARAVLEAEARGKGLVAFGAAQALKRWDDGTWALDLEPEPQRPS